MAFILGNNKFIPNTGTKNRREQALSEREKKIVADISSVFCDVYDLFS